MSGDPTETEIQAQCRAALELLETVRALVDDTYVGNGGLLQVLYAALEGEYLPGAYTAFGEGYRAGLASLISSGAARAVFEPFLYEYGRKLGFGSGYTNVEDLMRALREHFVANSLSVKSRNITFGNPSYGGSNAGNGVLRRLTVDQDGFDLEACTIEKKYLRCRFDQNSGAEKHAEVFEILGSALAKDDVARHDFGSGTASGINTTSRHGGTGAGGSLLRNSSFQTFDDTGDPKFDGWEEVSGAAQIDQDTSDYYRAVPGALSGESLKITGGSGAVVLKQQLDGTNVGALDPESPYFLRVMVNASEGSAVGGIFKIRLGTQEEIINVSDLVTAGDWQEVFIPIDKNLWFRNFNEEDLGVEIEWDASSTSGYILIDDVILARWVPLDGTYVLLMGNASGAFPAHDPWQVDDSIEIEDTGGAPADAIIQWWLFVSGLGCLPSVTGGGETFADP